MQIFKLLVSDCLEEVVVNKSEVKTLRKSAIATEAFACAKGLC